VGTFAWISLNHPADLSPPGGFTWRSFIFALSEHVFAVGIIIVLLDWFGRRGNHQGRWLAGAAGDSYTVYIIHPLVLVLITLSWQGIVPLPLANFILLAPVTLIACFGSAHLIRRLPLARKIL
jgi:peptidoglycan/LPS O-acetylase OafA/YrhL